MSTAASSFDLARAPLQRRLRASLVVRGALDTWRARVGLGIVAAVLFVAVFGPWLTPTSPYDVAGVPFAQPSFQFRAFGSARGAMFEDPIVRDRSGPCSSR